MADPIFWYGGTPPTANAYKNQLISALDSTIEAIAVGDNVSRSIKFLWKIGGPAGVADKQIEISKVNGITFVDGVEVVVDTTLQAALGLVITAAFEAANPLGAYAGGVMAGQVTTFLWGNLLGPVTNSVLDKIFGVNDIEINHVRNGSFQAGVVYTNDASGVTTRDAVSALISQLESHGISPLIGDKLEGNGKVYSVQTHELLDNIASGVGSSTETFGNWNWDTSGTTHALKNSDAWIYDNVTGNVLVDENAVVSLQIYMRDFNGDVQAVKLATSLNLIGIEGLREADAYDSSGPRLFFGNNQNNTFSVADKHASIVAGGGGDDTITP